MNCLQHVRSSGLGTTVCKSRATHRTLVTCNTSDSRHVQHVPCHAVRRNRSAVKSDRVEMTFMSALFPWAQTINLYHRTQGYRTQTASLASWLRHPPRERKIPGSNPACDGIFSGSSHTKDFKIGTPSGYPARRLAL